MNIASSKSIWGQGGRFVGEEVSSPFSSGGEGWGGVVQYRSVIKEKSPDLSLDLQRLASLYLVC